MLGTTNTTHMYETPRICQNDYSRHPCCLKTYSVEQEKQKRVSRRLGQIRTEPGEEGRQTALPVVDGRKGIQDPAVGVVVADRPVGPQLALDFEPGVDQVQWVECERRDDGAAGARGGVAYGREEFGCPGHLCECWRRGRLRYFSCVQGRKGTEDGVKGEVPTRFDVSQSAVFGGMYEVLALELKFPPSLLAITLVGLSNLTI